MIHSELAIVREHHLSFCFLPNSPLKHYVNEYQINLPEKLDLHSYNTIIA